MKGTVVFRDANKGSKSEGKFPYLELENGELVKVKLKGDNPFTNAKLKAFSDSLVEAEGEYNDNKTFIITEISKLESTVEEANEVESVKDEAEEEFSIEIVIEEADNEKSEEKCEAETAEKTESETKSYTVIKEEDTSDDEK